MKNKKILVVEDEILVAKDIQTTLTDLGYSCPEIASNHGEAIQKTKEIVPDLVILDIKLNGGKDGIKTAEMINKEFDLPIIYLTAYADKETLKRAKITEPAGYILKPFEERELHSNIEMAFYKHEMERERIIRNEAIESSINGILLSDLDGNINYANMSFLKMWKYKAKDEVINSPIVKFWRNKGKTVEIMDELFKNGYWHGELTAEKKNGKFFEVEISANIVKNKKNEPICILASFIDISDRKKAENKLLQTKNHLQDIINSTAEIVISFDKNNKLSIWNKTAEYLTGYKKRSVLGNKIEKIEIFNDPEKIIENMEKVKSSGRKVNEELILNTIDGTKKILSMSFMSVTDEEGKYSGSLLVGEDITHNKENHGKIISGYSYFFQDRDINSFVDLFNDISKSKRKALYITRSNKNLSKIKKNRNIEVNTLRKKNIDDSKNIEDIFEIEKKIEKFCNNEESIIAMDGLHYLIMKFSYKKFVDLLFNINEIISNSHSILLIHVDPYLFDKKQMAVIENEMHAIPSQNINEIKLNDDLYDMLKYIDKENKNNSLVSLKKITKKFKIVYLTASKRLKTLESKGLIYTKRNGKLKTVYISNKGKNLLNRRLIA